ncbi:MAG: DNA-directed RNA polymerase subunit beta [Mycoplasmatales bacterium]
MRSELQLGKNKRINFSNRKIKLDVPNLSDIQFESYRELVENKLEKVFQDYFPVGDDENTFEIRYKGFKIDKPEHDYNNILEYKNRGLNYTKPIKLDLELFDLKNNIKIQEQEIFLCDLPFMTDSGTFMINGVERVIVTQLVRSPDLYVTKDRDKGQHDEKLMGQIMPARGTRISIEERFSRDIFSEQKDLVTQIKELMAPSEIEQIGYDVYDDDEKLISATLNKEIKSAKKLISELKKEIRKNSIKVQFDSSRKVNLLSLFRLFGFSNENIINLFGDTRLTRNILYIDQQIDYYKAVNEFFVAQILSQNVAELDSEDFKKDIDTVVHRLKSRSVDEEDINKIEHGIMKLTNEEIRDLVINFVDNQEADGIIAEFLNVCKKNSIPRENTLIKKYQHNIESKRKVVEDLQNRFFLPRMYNFGDVGRFKFNLKSNLVLNSQMSVNSRFFGVRLAEDVVHTSDSSKKLIEGTKIGNSNIDLLTEILESGFGIYEEELYNPELGINEKVKLQRVYAYSNTSREIVPILGITSQDNGVMTLTMADILVFFNYFMGIVNGIGKSDDRDNLGNRRVRLVGELVEQEVSRGLYDIERNIKRYGFQNIEEDSTNVNIIGRIFTTNRFNNGLQRFFASSQLSQFMDQTNPLAELTHKRRLSALGPGGISRDRATMEVRDVHTTHYGRICPIESPEGGNIGLISSLTVYAKINSRGFIETPYIKVERKYDKDGKFVNAYITDQIDYLTAIDEARYYVGQSTIEINEATNEILTTNIPSRYNGENDIRHVSRIDYIEISPKQILSAGTGLIPFLEHDDANRALMGANMQRQAVPLMISESPIVGTGMEYYIGKDASSVIKAKNGGTVINVNSGLVEVQHKDGVDSYTLIKYLRSNHSTTITQKPIVRVGDKLKKGDLIADGNAMDNGELALGKNAVVAFLTWDGYNYEDAIIISDRLVKEDVYTSIHIEEYVCEVLQTKLGVSQVTRDIPNISEEAKKHLDSNGIVVEGTRVEPGDILVGKVTPKGKGDLSEEEKLLFDIFGEKTKDVKDESLRVENGGGGIVQKVLIYNADELEMASEVRQVVKVYVAQKRKIQEGDKMAGRHGNKGVISKILPQEDMPYLEDGTPVDIMLNPLGVPSRMNVGQVLEMHLGIIGKMLGLKFATEVFEGASNDDIQDLMSEAGIENDGKFRLIDGRTGEAFDRRVTIGVMYIMKLSHMVEDKMHARAIGPYSLVTQQPLGGKAQFGGQRFGEMEFWALEAYGAAHTLQEIITVKSDDIFGRSKKYEAILHGEKYEESVVTESYNVLLNEIQGLGIDLGMYGTDGKEIRMTDLLEY